MAPRKIPENKYYETRVEGEDCVVFTTIGKNTYEVIVDKLLWYKYLRNYSWTAIVSNGRVNVKTSIGKQSNTIWRVIIEKEKSELDTWGTTIDHINNNPLDNRLSNLRIFNSSILNATNISSKYDEHDMRYIYAQKYNGKINGYKVHYNVSGQTYYKNFGIIEYGSREKALEAARKYRDESSVENKENIIKAMIKKTRDIEFERGLRDKLEAGELDEILLILNKYKVYNCSN